MAVKTSTFSGWRLSGKDADAFLAQIKESAPNSQAKAAFAKGRPLAEEFLTKGQVVFCSQNKSLNKNK